MSTPKEAEVVEAKPVEVRNGKKRKPVEVLETIQPRQVMSIESLMSQAVQSGNLDAIERLMEVRRELKAEAAKEAFFAALSAFQSECPVIKKTKIVKVDGAERYRYAPLDVIVRIVAPILASNGLSYTIETNLFGEGKEGSLEAVCKVTHELGHMELSRFSIPIVTPTKMMSDSQAFGATSTFAKRYAFCNALGILTGDEDNDAVSSQSTSNGRQPVRQPQPTPTAQKAAQRSNGGEKPQLEPAAEGEAIDEKIGNGLALAMKHATLGISDFKKRFPQLERLGQIRRGDEKVVMSWIADPVRH